MRGSRFLPDQFTLLLLVVVAVATFFPLHGVFVHYFDQLINVAIALLFFLHGAKLSRQAVLDGLLHWRLHVVILAATFVLFPILGVLLQPLIKPVLGSALSIGVLYVCLLPSTVQSSIAFTSMARGNVAAALCSASGSNVLGMFITPLLVGVFILSDQAASAQHAMSSTDSGQVMLSIVLSLLLPFICGQLCSQTLLPWVKRHPLVVKSVDQGSILLVVYAAFSAAVTEGLWQQVSVATLLYLVLICCVLLAVVMLLLRYVSRLCGFNTADEITIVFCGSKKTLASGLPMAKILFAGQPMGLLILPLILFHQIQLMVCAVVAAHYAKRRD